MIKKIHKSDYVEKTLKKYNIPKEYTSINRRMISRGVFIGLFIAMIPMPLQMLVVFIFTFVGKFNFPVAIAMCWLSNPVTMPFIYFMEYKTGSYLLGMEVMDVQMSIEWFSENFSNIMVPLYFGAFCYSLVLSILAYYSINLYSRTRAYNYKKSRKNSNLK